MPATLVQSSGALSGSASSRTHNWGAALTPGNTVIIVSAAYSSGGFPTVTATDAGGNTYASRAASGNAQTGITLLDAIVATTAASSTVNFSAASDHSVVFMEWSGLNAFDQATQTNQLTPGSGANTITVGPTGTLAQADELIITGGAFATGLANSLISAPSGYTGAAFEQNSPSFIGMGAAYKVVASTAAPSAVWPYSSNSTGPGFVAAAGIATYRIAVPMAYLLQATPAAYVVSAPAARLSLAAKLLATVRAITIARPSALMRLAALLRVTPASYTVAAPDAAQRLAANLVATPAAYTVAAPDASLTPSTGAQSYVLQATPAAYAVATPAATLALGATLQAAPAAYAVTPASARLSLAAVLRVTPAAYLVGNLSAALALGRTLIAAPATYTVTGQVVRIGLDAVLQVMPAGYVVGMLPASVAFVPDVSLEPTQWVRWTVPAEVRTYTIRAERRVAAIPAERRVWKMRP